MSCQTVHQLRRLVHSHLNHSLQPFTALSGPLDWLICPPQSTIQLLSHRFPDFTKNGICLRKDRAYWPQFNLYFWHSFLVDDGEHRHVDINTTFENELARWQYLSRRFSSIDPTQTVFVLSNTQNNIQTEIFSAREQDQYHFTPALLEELHRTLAEFFATTTHNIHLEVLTRQDRMHNAEDSTYGYLLPIDHNEWKGSNRSWDRWWHQLLERRTRHCSTDKNEI